ncbi:hypothetical protein, partial [Pseudalkalibacillus decolorationis]|uniref:hypothetical protein n=1 Tax=Pseudalkalibacillus decolorationis TaxID=163879 RepID=UPI0021497135
QDMPRHRFPRFFGGSPNTDATSGSHIVPGWTLLADLSDFSSQRTPCPSFFNQVKTFTSATVLGKGKVTVWILTT